MLKKCYGLFLGLVVVAGSAYVTPTYASSAAIMITHIQAGSQASPQDERIAIYNNSSIEVDITNWCVVNKTLVEFACFTPPESISRVIIPGYKYATIASTVAVQNSPQLSYSLGYSSVIGSSGTIVASADTISLLDQTKHIIDQYGWTTNIASAQQWNRMKLSILPDIFIDTNTLKIGKKYLIVLFRHRRLYTEII